MFFFESRIELIKKFVTFGTVGAVGTAAHYLTLIGLVELIGFGPVFSSGTGAIVGALVNYRLNYSFTFRSTQRHRDVIVKFLSVAACGFTLNVILMRVFTGPLHIHYLPSQVLSTGVVLVWNFVGNLLWSFRSATVEP